MRSLQAKLTLALLLTSLTSVALVGLVARGMLQNKFNQIAMEQSLLHFRGMLQAYITTYGSWDKAQQAQAFPDFVRQQNQATTGGRPSQTPGTSPLHTTPTNPPAPSLNPPAPDNALSGQQPPVSVGQQPISQQPIGQPMAPPRPFPQTNGMGRPPAGHRPGTQAPDSPVFNQSPGSPAFGNQGAPSDPRGPQGEPADEQHPRSAGESVFSNFRFIVLLPDGKVVMGPPEMRERIAPDNLRSEAQPVVVNGQAAVLVVPYGQPNYTKQDRDYLAAVRQALWRGVLAATMLAVALGLFFGNRLSRRLRELTGAIEAMSDGKLRQQVAVEANDEVGVLAAAFNRMSAELAQAHDKLHESHAKISRQAQMLKELAVRDGLTKLHNRRFFDERGAHAYAQAKRYNRPLTVMIGDIDHFKRINDTFSHAIGDEVLRHVAAILQKNTRESDIVARYGGEEFVVAFPETDLLQALALCERLRMQIETYGWHNIHPDLRVTMSMGLNQDLTLESFEKLVAAADTRLYNAKESGRNRVCAPVEA